MSKYVIGSPKWPLSVTFEGLGTLEPKDDLTPKEAVQLTMMLVSGSVGSFVDFVRFVDENGLRRHFSNSTTDNGTAE